MRMVVAMVLGVLGLTAGAFECTEDFSVVDERGGAYGLDIWRNSTLTHNHGWVEDGRYRIPVDGNRHFIAAPALRDFRLEADYELVPFRRLQMTLGYILYFRYDREADVGNKLEVYYDFQFKLHIVLNGRELKVREDGKLPKLSGLRLVLDVRGTRGTLETLGEKLTFELPADGPERGEIGFDLTTNESIKLLIDRYRLSSDENPALTEIGTWRFELSRAQGFLVAPTYEVKAERYATGETRLTCRLSGTDLSAPKRQPSGGTEWAALTGRLSDPYVKVTDADGTSRKFFFWNGRRQFCDPQVVGEPPFPWPSERTFIVRNFPRDFTIAAGYHEAVVTPWRFVGQGHYEQIQSAGGAVFYEGVALEGKRVGLKVKSPEDKLIVSKIPADLPERARAVNHAKRGHYFLESETPRFTYELTWRRKDYVSTEIQLMSRLESVFGDKSGIAVIPANDEVVSEIGPGVMRRTGSFKLQKNPGVGVWHLETKVVAGIQATARDERTVFEVLSNTPGGKAPPLVSGLPEFVSMPNEIKFLEDSAFDPWSELDGVTHYYSIDMRNPKVGERLKVWEADHLYGRKYFTWSSKRNTDDWDPAHECNREYLRHADYCGLYPFGKDEQGRIDYCQTCFYHSFQLEVLKDYLKLRNLKLKLLTPERIAQCEREKQGISQDELKELFDTCWDDFKAYGKQRADKFIQEHVDYIMSVNPKTARASYGPLNIYTARYKCPYALETNSHPVESDPRIRANGSFWLFEDYHYSCDYPLCRPAYFAAGYCLYYPNGRRLFPEIYYRGWVRCEDGAVYQAHPDQSPYLAYSHQRRLVYQYVYGTAFRRDDGTFGFWKDDGFHARNPEKEAMDEFIAAWGKSIRNRPVRPLKAPYFFIDSDAIRRHGDTYVPNGSYSIVVPGMVDVRSDVVNTAEEALGYSYEMCCAAGFAAPVVARFAALDALTREDCEFAVLPPLVKGTPPEVIDRVRRAHERGINLMIFEAAEGLEDLFDVSGKTDFARKETKWGRTVFMKRPPTMVGRSTFLQRFSRGRENVSEEMNRGTQAAFAYLSSQDANRAERGTMMATVSEKGDYIVILSDDSPIYGDTDVYPMSFRFTVTAPGIGNRRIEADAPYSIVSRTPDRLTIRTITDKDSAQFFKFK